MLAHRSRSLRARNKRPYRAAAAATAAVGLTVAAFAMWVPSAFAATAVDLGTADSFVVLGGSTVTNTGPSVLNGNLGVAPGTAITGFPPGLVNGVQHSADGVAAGAKADLESAYTTTAGLSGGTSIDTELGGELLVPGIYKADVATGITGALQLDAVGNPDAVWIFQIGSTLTTASSSSVVLLNGAQACNVFWQVGSSATLGTDTDFVGTIMARTSITLTTGADVIGRALALDGAVTLDTNVFTFPECAVDSTGATTGDTTGATTGDTTGDTTGATTGDTTGATTGDSAGATTGDTTGDTTGATSGDTTGATTGDTTGATAGDTTGDTTGATAGDTTGDTTGATTGDTTGATTGDTTGATTGDTTGDTTGATTGDTTGATTGDTTGATTGDTTGDTTGATSGDTTGDTTGATSGDTTGATTGDTTGVVWGDTSGVTDVAVVTPAASAGKTLPATGFDGLWLLPMGAMLLIAGVALLASRRTRAGS